MSYHPSLCWSPTDHDIKTTNLYHWMKLENMPSYEALHQWSYAQHADFIDKLVKRLPIIFKKPYDCVLDLSTGAETPVWFKEGLLNIVDSCFKAKANDLAIIQQDEYGNKRICTYDDLNVFSNKIASAILKWYPVKSRFAIIMPMTIEAVAIHLGIIKAGCQTIAIAESFSKTEIKSRLEIANASGIFIQDHYYRNQKKIVLYDHLSESLSYPMIVISNEQHTLLKKSNDITFDDLLQQGTAEFTSIACAPMDYTTILFSSGTTAAPKAIPWDHTTGIKCASDAFFHHDLKPGDIFLWPTSLGWMMGSWLIYATLINNATMALFNGAPTHPAIFDFIETNKVTHVGVVPTLVKAWRDTKCLANHHLSSVKLFTSTGECSNPDDMFYLMNIAGNKPIIEYCGGTEIGGAYITSTLLTPIPVSCFTTPAMGIHFQIVDTAGNLATIGEVMLLPPALGLSTTLLNADHHAVYYEALNQDHTGKPIQRRHGDRVERFENGDYRLLGRADDTFNISGIKFSCVEIEEALKKISQIKELAVSGVSPPDGGPSLLVVFAVLHNPIPSTESILHEAQTVLKQTINPLIKLHDFVILETLPRTASNKVLRRLLKQQYEDTL